MLILSFFFSFLFIMHIRCDNDEIFIDQAIARDLPENYVEFFKLTIPDKVTINTTNLIIRVKENDDAELGKDEFSDPDIYVSKTNPEPEDPNTSTWYSERYGEDIISIPNTEVKSGETFYIGVYCQRKCKYELLASLNMEYEITDGVMFNAYLAKKTSFTYKIKSRTNFEEMQIISFAPKLGAFRMFVSKDSSVSSQNTMMINPTWQGGYVAEITKGTSDYCEGCFYHILLEAEFEDVEVYFLVIYEDTFSTIRSVEPVFSTLKANRPHCYSFEFTSADVKEKFIIQTTLFSGSALIKVTGWDNKTVPKFTDVDDWTYEVLSEKVIILSPEERQKISEYKENGNLNFCLISAEPTSYLVKAYLGSETEDLQKFNFLKNGVPVTGYLPMGEVTKYRTIDFTRDSDITINLEVTAGEPKLYGYICTEMKKCHFTKDEVNKQLTNGALIQPKTSGINYKVTVPSTINTCHKLIKDDQSLDNERKSVPCGILAVVTCEGKEDCGYKITFSYSNSIVELYQRTSYYQLIPYNETDYYKFTIQDDQADLVTIVLNAISGDVDLLLYSRNPLEVKNPLEFVIDSSYNGLYIPNVIKLDREKLKQPSLKGDYYIGVRSNSFSTYSVYYYTSTNTKSSEPTIADVIMELSTGHIIKDFFEKDTQYKIYSYNPKIPTGNNNLDIRITITPESSQYSIYVFRDINKMQYDPTSFEMVKNSDWQSEWNNEVIISKNDTNYSGQDNYYIVVLKRSEDPSKEHIPSFYIGVTNEFYPFLLYESMPSLITLDSSYSSQSYWYTHPDIKEPLSLSLNLFYGRVSVYVDFKEIRDYNTNNVAFSQIDVDKAFITIEPDVISLKCGQLSNCGVYIMIIKSSSSEAQYLLTVKSHSNKKELLIPGLVKTDQLLLGEYKYFYTGEANTKTDSIISVSFTNGFGNVYANILPDDQSVKSSIFPNATQYEFKGSDFYLGKIIYITKDKFTNCKVCRLMITVVADQLGYTSNDVEYAISYYTEGKRINQNQPYRSSIKRGEMQFYSFYFGRNVESLYISLTNMEGEAELYLNHGSIYPTYNNYTWFSTSPFHQFIEISKDDPYFVSKGLNDVSGNYTLMIFGYMDSSFTLYATTHPNKIIGISDYVPASCLCKKAGDSCLFRYDNVVPPYSDFVSNAEFVVTTDFLYGGGKIFGKLYNTTDYDILKGFPSNSDYDYSSVDKNTRNMLDIKISKDDKKLTKDSMLLFNVECVERSFFDINIARMIESDVRYIDLIRENIFFLQKSSSPTTLIFYNYQDKDLNFEVSAYTGEGNFLVYLNDTNWNSDKAEYVTRYEHIAVFDVVYPEKQSYHNTLKSTLKAANQNVYFKVTPKTDLAFYVRLNYDQEWTRVKMNKLNVYRLNEKVFHGYFDMLEEYTDAVLTIQTDDPLIQADVYVKMNIFDKKKNETKSEFGNSLPDYGNYDYKGSTNAMLSSVSLRLPGVTKQERGDKYVRYLFKVTTIERVYSDKDIKINIIVTPNVGNLSRIEARQNYYYYGQGSVNKEFKTIFDLTKNDANDDLLVVELSSCRGDTKYQLSDEIMFFSGDNNDLLKHTPSTSNGRKLLLASDLESSNYFLSVTAINSQDQVCIPSNSTDTSCDPEYMMYYFTTTKNEYRESFFNRSTALEYEPVDSAEVLLRMPSVLSKDGQGKVSKQKKLVFQTYISENATDFSYMESVCYLSKMESYSTQSEDYNPEDNTLRLRDLSPNKKYFVNILVKNMETKELIAFRPIEVVTSDTGLSLFAKIIIGVVIGVLLLITFYFYRKFTITREILNYEVNDIRNQTNVPKSLSEMKDIVSKRNAQKYTTLTEDISKV